MTIDALRAEQETMVVRALLQEWRVINDALFGGSLRPPVLRLFDCASLVGSWQLDTRHMSLRRQFACAEPWGRVIEVLKHEMAHQFVDEVLGVRDEGPHGQAFRRVCEERAIDGRTFETDEPAVERARGLLARVEKLLALAASDNRHEAEAAMERAQALMRTHNLEAVRGSRGPGRHPYGFIQLGSPKGRIYEPARQIAGILSEHFFVDTIWVSAYDVAAGRRGWVLEVCGTAENLAIAEYVHGFLWDTAERLWQAHREAHGIKNQRDRRRFYVGVMRGFSERLGESREVAEQQGLVWIQDADLMRYLRARHPHVRTVRRSGERSGDAMEAGRAVGRAVVLNKPIRGQAASRGRLLTDGRSRRG